MGPVIIQLSKQWFSGTNYVFYPIDNGTFPNLLATTPGQFLAVDVIPTSLITYALTSYTL
jgi:hypothetical protein